MACRWYRCERLASRYVGWTIMCNDGSRHAYVCKGPCKFQSPSSKSCNKRTIIILASFKAETRHAPCKSLIGRGSTRIEFTLSSELDRCTPDQSHATTNLLPHRSTLLQRRNKICLIQSRINRNHAAEGFHPGIGELIYTREMWFLQLWCDEVFILNNSVAPGWINHTPTAA